MKSNIKFLLLIGIIMFMTLLLSMNTSKAVEMSEDEIQAFLDEIPETIELGIPEDECSEANLIVYNKVKEILNNKGFTLGEPKSLSTEIEADITDVTTTCETYQGITDGWSVRIRISVSDIYFTSKERFYKGSILIYLRKNDTINNGPRKEFDVVYNNTNNYNAADEQYVKNITLNSLKYHEVDPSFIVEGGNYKWGDFFRIAEKNYQKQINDDSIKIVISAGAGDGGLNILTAEGGSRAALFRNGVLYEIRIVGPERSVPVINVPSNIKDDELNAYIIAEISKYDELGEYIESIQPGTKDLYGLGIDIPDGYTVHFRDYYVDDSAIIIRREKSVEVVEDSDEATNIKLESDTTVVPEGTVLECGKITDENDINNIKGIIVVDGDKFVAYDISLTYDGEKIQPDGNVKLSIPIPDSFDKNNIAVYRIDDNGKKIKYNHTISGNYAVINADHFSTYVVADLSTEEDDDKNDNVLQANEEQEKNEKIFSNPKTGDSITLFVALLIVGIFSVSILIKKNKINSKH